MGNPITWFEIVEPDPERTATFYSELFGWHTQHLPESSYHLIDTHGRTDTHSGNGINGGIARTHEGQPAGSVVYSENPDIPAVLDRAESLGAKTVVPVRATEMVTFAQFTDPWGNLIGLVQGDGSTRVSEGDNPPVTWFDLLCAEPRAAWDFYRDLFGWDIEESSGGSFEYGLVSTGDQGKPGGIGSSPDGRGRTTVYAQVDDLQKYLERAESLGGRTTMQPTEVGGDTSIAVFEDPQGLPFGLFVHQH